MSDASKAIAEQFRQAGAVPQELVPQGGVSKTYVDTQDGLLQTSIQSAAGIGASAQQTANTALTNANSAQGIAGQAQSTANTAKNTADSALSVASTAQTTANTAVTNAATAQTRADEAYTLAQQGSTAVPSFGKINSISAGQANDTFTFAEGSGISLSPNAGTKTITISATGGGSGGTVPDGTLDQKGIVQLSSTAGIDESKAATPKLVKDAFDAGTRAASTTQAGQVQLNDAINSTSTTQAGTANGVRKAYDRGSNALTVAQTPASTTTPGRVQLNDTNTSTATDQALTANAGRVTYEIATALGSTTQVGRVQTYDGIDSTRTDLVATANAVRIAASMGGGGGGGTTAAMTYYVDGVAGNDANDGLTQSTAVKTPQVAVDKLYALSGGKLNHLCTIRIKGAQTYPGSGTSLVIGGFSGAGDLIITRLATEGAGTLTGSIRIDSCTCRVSFQFLFPTGEFRVTNCSYVLITSVTVTSASLSASSGFVIEKGSTAFITSCQVNNRDVGIESNNSRVSSSSNSGTGNRVALSARFAGVIGKADAQPAGTTAQFQDTGGVIR